MIGFGNGLVIGHSITEGLRLTNGFVASFGSGLDCVFRGCFNNNVSICITKDIHCVRSCRLGYI